MTASCILRICPAAVLLAVLACCASGVVGAPVARINPDDGFAAQFVDPATSMEFRLIAGGEFLMGSPAEEPGRDDDEGPQHRVIISAFCLGKYEVTRAQWQAVMGDCPAHFQGSGRLPIENVSWHAARKFVARLGKQSGLPYRLPTEAEWEYACRAGSDAPFCCGSDNQSLYEYAWIAPTAGGETHAVGTRRPNAWGLYDMHGNVSEWVADGRRGYLSRLERDPRGLESATRALHRGGAWLHPARICRCANRMSSDKNYASHTIGLRVALDATALPGGPVGAKSQISSE